MANDYTSIYRFQKVEVGARDDLWGDDLNSNTEGLDDVFADQAGSLTTTGSATAYVITPNYAGVTTLSNGLRVFAKAHIANTTTTPTLAYNALTATTIKKVVNGSAAALDVGDIPLGHRAEFVYSSTDSAWLLLNPYDWASVTQYRAATANRVLTTDVLNAGAYVALTDGATIAVDLSLGINFSVTLGGNRALGNPTFGANGAKVGQSGVIKVLQDATGSRTLSYGTNYEWAGTTAGVLSTAASSKDVLFYFVDSSTSILLSLNKAFA